MALSEVIVKWQERTRQDGWVGTMCGRWSQTQFGSRQPCLTTRLPTHEEESLHRHTTTDYNQHERYHRFRRLYRIP